MQNSQSPPSCFFFIILPGLWRFRRIFLATFSGIDACPLLNAESPVYAIAGKWLPDDVSGPYCLNQRLPFLGASWTWTRKAQATDGVTCTGKTSSQIQM